MANLIDKIFGTKPIKYNDLQKFVMGMLEYICNVAQITDSDNCPIMLKYNDPDIRTIPQTEIVSFKSPIFTLKEWDKIFVKCQNIFNSASPIDIENSYRNAKNRGFSTGTKDNNLIFVMALPYDGIDKFVHFDCAFRRNDNATEYEMTIALPINAACIS